MEFRVNLELLEGRWIGFVTDSPGCFAAARTRAACEDALPSAISAYRAWHAAHGVDLAEPATRVVVDEVSLSWQADAEYEVNAFFASDRAPLRSADVERAEQLLCWTRDDVLGAISGLSPGELSRNVEDEWSIERVLLHIGGAEWWYLDRLGLAPPRDTVPDDPFERLEMTRGCTVAALPRLVDADLLTCRTYEVWSPRKLVRRMLWHERDHTEHIWRFRESLLQSA